MRPRGLAHVVRRVTDLERSAAFYRKFFGPETRTEQRRSSSARRTRAGSCEPAAAGEAAAHRPFRRERRALRRAAVTRGLEALGARIVAATPERLHFRCPDGLGVELLPVDPARIWGLA